jgi:hypothetical protein
LAIGVVNVITGENAFVTDEIPELERIPPAPPLRLLDQLTQALIGLFCHVPTPLASDVKTLLLAVPATALESPIFIFPRIVRPTSSKTDPALIVSLPSFDCAEDDIFRGASVLHVGGVHPAVGAVQSARADNAVAPRRNPTATSDDDMIFFFIIKVLSINF